MSHRMDAKPIVGAHGRVGGDLSAPFVQTLCCQQWICCDTAFVSMRGAGAVRWSTSALVCAIPIYAWSSRATDEAFSREAVKMHCRPRVTRHGGTTKTAVPDE